MNRIKLVLNDSMCPQRMKNIVSALLKHRRNYAETEYKYSFCIILGSFNLVLAVEQYCPHCILHQVQSEIKQERSALRDKRYSMFSPQNHENR